jgi:hypothetical protein
MRDSHLKWLSHIQNKAINAPVRKSGLIQVERTKKKVEEDQK